MVPVFSLINEVIFLARQIILLPSLLIFDYLSGLKQYPINPTFMFSTY